ncbi:hypothetical protein IJ384_04680 [bacterium]|nr:hypothetical protein [bacterium]
MLKKDCKRIKKIKEHALNISREGTSLACDINSLGEIAFDYCNMNTDSATANLMVIAEILEEKSKKLINIIDTETMEIFRL